MQKFEKIPKGKLRITCLDGLSHNAKITTSNGDLIYASKVIIDLTPGKPCTAIITVPDVQIDVCSEKEIDEDKFIPHAHVEPIEAWPRK